MDITFKFGTLIIIWLLAVLAIAGGFKTFGWASDNLFWLVWPVIIATFVFMPALYTVASW